MAKIEQLSCLVPTRATPGLYIVTLNNEHLISVNANDPRVADTCIRVSRANCKFGKTKDLAVRCGDYVKIFGFENVNFRPIALTREIALAERQVKNALKAWMMRGNTGRRNEWLEGISAAEAERLAIAALESAGIEFELPKTEADVRNW